MCVPESLAIYLHMHSTTLATDKTHFDKPVVRRSIWLQRQQLLSLVSAHMLHSPAKMTESAFKLTFRRAKIEDIKTVHEMIKELADFEKMSDGPKLSEADLIRDAGLSGGTELCHIYVLDYTKDNKTQTIGYAICFHGYSTWLGRTYFLEDIYVRPQFRQLGAGSCIFRGVAAQALAHNCTRVDFHVLRWNPARKFYERLGATDLTVGESAWHLFRLDDMQIAKLAAESS